MTNEEMEQAIQFLIENQAQISAEQMKLTGDVQTLTAGVEKLTADVQKLTADVQTLTESQGLLTQAIIANTGQIGRLADAQARTDVKFQEMAQAQVELAERLNAFIVVVERYISERSSGNGSSQS
jgi:outer membrane murein-binding lipoprotein Lpp